MRHSQLVGNLEVNNLHRSKSDPAFKAGNHLTVTNRQDSTDKRANTPQSKDKPVKNSIDEKKNDKMLQCKLFAQSQFQALQKFKYTQMSNRIRIQTEEDLTPKLQRPQTPKSTHNPVNGYTVKQPQEALKQYFTINTKQKHLISQMKPSIKQVPTTIDEKTNYFMRSQEKKLFGQQQPNKSKISSSSYHALNFNTFQKSLASPSMHKDYSIQNLEKKAKLMTYDIYKSKFSTNNSTSNLNKNSQRELFKKIYNEQKEEKQTANQPQTPLNQSQMQKLDSSKAESTPNQRTRKPQSTLLDQFVTRVPQAPTDGINSPKFIPGSLEEKKHSNQVDNSILLAKNRLNLKEHVYYVSTLKESLAKPNQNNFLYQLYREHFIQSFTAMNFCFNLQSTDQSIIDTKKVSLKRNDNLLYKKTIVFDLDETLIHCNESSATKSDVYLPILFPTGQIIQAGINVRPYAIEILKELSNICEVVVFTASHQCYASKVIQYLDPKKQMISGMLFRENCVVTGEGVHIKDLRVINRDLKDMVLIDNAAYSFGYQVENGIPIIPFYENKNDTELHSLLQFLKKHVLPAHDVREVVTSTFKFGRFNEFLNPQTAAEKIFGGND